MVRENAKAAFNLAGLEAQQGRLGEARAAYQQAIDSSVIEPAAKAVRALRELDGRRPRRT